MSFPRSSIARSSLIFCWPLLVACSGEEFANAPASGQAGTSGSAGLAGIAGQAGLSGSSGQAGTAGNSGQGGTAGGQAGLGGAGGATGGQGGTPGGQAGKAGAGGQGECTVGEFKCQGDNLLVCALATKKFEVLETCNPGKCKVEEQSCVDDCKTNEVRCLGDELQTCEMGSFKTKETCKKELCSETEKKCLLCVPGLITACKTDQIRLACDDQGEPTTELLCPPEMKYCVDGGDCVECRDDKDCAPLPDDCRDAVCVNHSCGIMPLEAGKLAKTQVKEGCFNKICDGFGEVKNENLPLETPCKADDGGAGICSGNGQCGVCKPGQVECASGGSLRACNKQGQWDLPNDCPKGKPVCGDNTCLGVKQVSLGYQNGCAVIENGTVRCWGDDSQGNLGQGKNTLISRKPVEVPSLVGIAHVTVGWGFACALDAKGQAFCWGNNSQGQTGTNTQGSAVLSPTPIDPIDSQGFKKLAAGATHICGVVGFDLWCWGSNSSGKIIPESNAAYYKLPTQVSSVKDKQTGKVFSVLGELDVLAGTEHTCAFETGALGLLTCWGDNSKIQLGITNQSGSSDRRASQDVSWKDYGPKLSLVGNGFVTGLWGHSQNPFVFYWGNGPSGTFFVDNPGVLALEGDPPSSYFSLASDIFVSSNENYMKVFGKNQFGQLGDGSKKDTAAYLVKHSTTGLTGNATNGRTVCAWEDAGRVLCWGDNTDGLTGTDSFADSILIPTEVKW